MNTPFIHMLPYAAGIAISPVPVITMILMLFSARPMANGLLFLSGWALGVALPAIAVIMFSVKQGATTDNSTSAGTSAFRIITGIVLLAVAVRNWLARNRPIEETSKNFLVRLMKSIKPWKALLTGFLFADLTNPKNMALTIGGCMEISASRLSLLGTSVMVFIFVLISSMGVAFPLVLYSVGGNSSRRNIETMRQWILVNKNVVTAVLFLVFGMSFLVKGIGSLVS